MDEAKKRMSDYLPEELWVQVLVRLPIDSIVRCRGVSNAWNSLIKSQHFIAAQLRFKRRDETQNSCLLVRDCIAPREEYYEFYHDDERSLDKFAGLRCPFPVRGIHFEVVGTCNGLLCLYDEDRKGNCNLFLWNPLLRKSVWLPSPNLQNSRENLRPSLGFGVDPVTNDYKVVRVVNLKDGGCLVEIFRLSSNSWENDSDGTVAKFDFLKPEQAFLDGMVYWIGRSYKFGNKIVSFDLSTERFEEMELPESLASKSTSLYNASVDIYMGSLAVVVAAKSEYCIWILKEKESWEKQVCFGFHMNHGWPFGFRGNGDIQFMKTFGRWDSFNPTHLKSKFLGVRPFTNSYLLRSLYGTPYVESLVFVDEGRDFNDTVTLEKLMLVYSGESDPEEEDSIKSDSDSGDSYEFDTEDDIE